MDAEDAFIFCNDALASTCFPTFERMRRNGEYCDLVVKVGEKSISAHRMVIAVNIPYFRSVLGNSEGDCTPQEVIVPKMDPNAVESLIEYAYSGKVKITLTNVTSLLSSSKHLQVDVVRDACCEFLSKRLNPNNVLRIREFADSLGCSKLVETADRYVRENFDEVFLSEEFLELSLEYVQELIRRDDLCASCEEKVLEAVLRWIKKAPAERNIRLLELLNDIRMPLISLKYLSDHVAKEQLIQESMICRDLIDDARNYHLFPQQTPNSGKFNCQPRCFKDYSAAAARSAVDGIYAVCDTSATERTVQRFDPKTEKWHVIATKADGFKGDAIIAAMGHRLYIFEGRGSSYVHVFDRKTLIWSVISPMKTEAYSAAVATHREKLYVCGGCDSLGSSLTRVERYDPEDNMWSEVTSMLNSRHAAAVVTIGNYIYVLGGKLNSSFLNNVEKFDPKSSKWIAVANMEGPRAGHGAVTMNGRIYVCGGRSGTWDVSGCEVYDPLIDKWHNICGLNVSRRNLSVVSYRGKLYAFGGLTYAERLKNYEVYDPENNQWILSDTVLPIVSFLGVVAFDNF